MTPAFAGVHVLADDDPRWTRDVVTQAETACEGGAAVVQLRVKHAHDERALAWARAIRRLTREAGVSFVMNDRADLGLLAEADGVHLGQSDLPPGALPKAWRERIAVGRSTHTIAQARRALEEGVDYLAFGPVFGTTSKDSEYGPRGLDALEEIVQLALPLPVIAIGGIAAENAARVSGTGAAGIAVISAVADAAEGASAVKALVAAFEPNEASCA